MKDYTEYFIKHVSIAYNGCWLWTGNRQSQGYGRAGYNGGHIKAHRLAWLLFVGEIPDKTFVLHKCDNPPCVNPEHLELGNHSKNLRDAAIRDRMNSKISNKQVSEIKQILEQKLLTHKQIAEAFKVSTSLITRISLGQRRYHCTK